MDTIRPPHATPRPGIPPENREQTPAVPGPHSPVDRHPVTAHRANGVAQPSTGLLAYEVDSLGHRVVARYPDGRIAFAFGAYGHGAGQFDTPLDIVTISPEFSGEPTSVQMDAANLFSSWLAVADYGNRRVQFFECDGAWVGETELDPGQPPCQLAWRAPALVVSTLEGQLVRVHVAASLLASSRRAERHEVPARRDSRDLWRVC